MSRSIHKIFFAVLAGLALSFGAGGVSADTISYTLGVSNLGGSYTGPFATVDVNRTSNTTATITFTSLSNGGYIYLMGDGGAAAVNVSGTFSVANIAGSNSLSYSPSFTPGSYSTSSGSNDGFGSFNLRINSEDGWGHTANTITFDLTATGINSWATAGSVLVANTVGNVASVHVFPCTASAGACLSSSPGANGTTGYASQVPIPAAAWLFGSGLIGLIVIARRRRP